VSKNRGFNVSGACYPEVHQEAANMIEDIQNLKKSIENNIISIKVTNADAMKQIDQVKKGLESLHKQNIIRQK